MGEEKWKVLIADDEYLIGQLIRKLINWEKLNLEFVDIVNNGESAYEAILEKKPDIVITDIRMPKINGLELVCMTKKVMENVRFIIISGYKEFDYAHKALQYGVNDYLLKPINEAELGAVMEKLIKELSMGSEALRQQEELKKTADAGRQIIRRDLLNNILEKQRPLSPKEVEQEYNVELNAPLYRGIDIKLDYANHKKTDQKQDRLTLDRVVATVEQILKECVREELLCEKPGMHIYCLFNYEPESAKSIRRIINDILSEIQDYLLGFEQYVVTIGVGTEKNEFALVGHSITEAGRAVGNRIKLGVGRLIYADSLQLTETVEPSFYILPYREGFLRAVETFSVEAMGLELYKMFAPFQNAGDIDCSVCYSMAEELIALYFENMGAGSKEAETLKDYLKAAVLQCYSIPALRNLLKQGMGQYLEASKRLMEAEPVRSIRQAVEYIEEHFSEKIILEDIAAIVDLNPVYLSVLFKKETGKNFSAYLVHVRMEHAKLQLKKGNATIAAVAEMVGYKDSRYFSQTFARTVGVKPALYRKLHQ